MDPSQPDYGSSVYWQCEAVHLAKQSNEWCQHLRFYSLRCRIKEANEAEKKIFRVKLTCQICQEQYPKTSELVRKKILEIRANEAQLKIKVISSRLQNVI